MSWRPLWSSKQHHATSPHPLQTCFAGGKDVFHSFQCPSIPLFLHSCPSGGIRAILVASLIPFPSHGPPTSRLCILCAFLACPLRRRFLQSFEKRHSPTSYQIVQNPRALVSLPHSASLPHPSKPFLSTQRFSPRSCSHPSRPAFTVREAVFMLFNAETPSFHSLSLHPGLDTPMLME